MNNSHRDKYTFPTLFKHLNFKTISPSPGKTKPLGVLSTDTPNPQQSAGERFLDRKNIIFPVCQSVLCSEGKMRKQDRRLLKTQMLTFLPLETEQKFISFYDKSQVLS